MDARREEVQGAAARIERAQARPGGPLRVSTRLEAPGGARVRDARLVPARETGCGQGAALAHAGELWLQQAAQWQRPLAGARW